MHQNYRAYFFAAGRSTPAPIPGLLGLPVVLVIASRSAPGKDTKKPGCTVAGLYNSMVPVNGKLTFFIAFRYISVYFKFRNVPGCIYGISLLLVTAIFHPKSIGK